MAITNVAKPTTSLTNTNRVSFAELWSTISTTWAAETRTWADCVSLIDNVDYTRAGSLWLETFPWLESYPWLSSGGITNIAKP